ncbi:RbsD/FucU family protein [Enorma phocaeensis]|uniref:RbsD/FucU family protein n=1 Tax=Enorma phocaeensis TaxID=1871019 RepID=UPI00195E848D|nr:RbsD/FucU domain-containing protein [Enorma phocaeensis]MBM6953218.1 fucose isomerase [Enorma phocaeensis]
MLKGVPAVISPELLKILAEMGHGDEIVIADANYPAASTAKHLVRADGISAPQILDAVLTLMPLDTYVEAPVALMATVGDDPRPEIWDTYRVIIDEKAGADKAIEHVSRFDFYDRGANAYAVIATGEHALYANLILKKGVIN